MRLLLGKGGLNRWCGGGNTKTSKPTNNNNSTWNLFARLLAWLSLIAPSMSLPLGLSCMTAEAISRTRETTLVGSKAHGERPSTIPAPNTWDNFNARQERDMVYFPQVLSSLWSKTTPNIEGSGTYQIFSSMGLSIRGEISKNSCTRDPTFKDGLRSFLRNGYSVCFPTTAVRSITTWAPCPWGSRGPSAA